MTPLALKEREIGFGPLDSLVHLKEVTDVMVTPEGRVWIDAGDGLEERFPDIPFTSPERVKEYAVQLCAQLGRRLDNASPIADASASSGLRVHAVIDPLVPYGASISIRIPASASLSLKDLEKRGFLPSSWSKILRILLLRHASIIISGGTGAGKTTLLRALLNECDPRERIVAVEEVREIGRIQHGNFVSLASREKNVEGAGEVTLSQLVTATLRMRPDRIVLGECRGGEVADVLRAFNTGHRGGLVTLHSNGVEHVPRRLVSLGQLGGLSAVSLLMLVEGAFDVILHVERTSGVRRLRHIGCLAPSVEAGGNVQGVVLSEWENGGIPVIFPGWEAFSHRWQLEEYVR